MASETNPEGEPASDAAALIVSLGHHVISVDPSTRTVLAGQGADPGGTLEGLFPAATLAEYVVPFLERAPGAAATFEYRSPEEGPPAWRRATMRRSRSGGRVDIVTSDLTELVMSRLATLRVERTRRLAAAVYEAEDVGAGMATVCGELREILGVTGVALYLFDEATGMVTAAKVSVVQGVTITPRPVTRESAVALLRAGWVTQFPDLRTADLLMNRDYLLASGVKSLAVAGIGRAPHPIGLLNVISTGTPRTFSDDEMALLAEVADVLAAPLARAALLDERARSEARAHLADAHLRAALDATNTGIWELDFQGGTVTWDPRCFEIWEVPPEGGPDRLLVMSRMHADDSPRVEAAFKAACAPGGDGGLAIEYRYLGPSGVPRWIAARGRCLFEGARPVRFIGTVVDATGRRQADDQRIAAERRYREIVEAMSEGIAVVDLDGRVVFANRAYATMFGFARDAQAVGVHIDELLFPEDRAAERGRYTSQVASGGATRTEGRFRTRDAQELWASVAGVPLREGGEAGEAGPVIGVLLILTDITVSRRLEAKLQQAQKLESLGVLAGGVAHDFNNLLVGILGNAGLARAELDAGSRAVESVEAIEVAATRASELTRQLLAYAGKGRFVIASIDLRRLVEEMGHLLASVIGKGVRLRYQFGHDVPSVLGDATQLRQVVMNLVTNASDAIGEATGIITVATSFMQADRGYLSETLFDDELPPGPFVALEVSDTGTGMSAETRARIFDPFFSTKFTGRGLGLAAVLGIMRTHRGTMKVYSEVGRGTTFKMLLPAIEGRADQPSPVAQAPLPAPREPGVILVVDDEETVRGVMRRVLEKAGFTVLLAFDGVEGVAAFREHQAAIRAVILDVTMPRMGGEETFRELRRIDPEVRVLLASGYSEAEATGQFAGKGLAGFIEKPFRPRDLVEKLRSILEAAGTGG